MMRGRHRNVRIIVGDGDPVVWRVAQRVGLATYAVPQRRCCHKLNRWWWWRRRPYGSSEGGRMLSRLKVGTGAPAWRSEDK